MFHIAVVEDQKSEAENIQKAALAFFEQHKEDQCEISLFCDGEDFLANYKLPLDVIFMDVEMPKRDGLSTAKEFRKSNPDIPLVFITSFARFAINGYEVNALDYLLKPIQYPRFESMLFKVIRQKKSQTSLLVPIKTVRESLFVESKDIIYISISDHLITYHLINKDVDSWGTLNDLEPTLPKDFIRINKTEIVNLYHVKSLKEDTLFLSYGKEVKASRRRRNEVAESLTDYMVGRQS